MLPSNLHFQNKVESAYARSYTTHIQPQNGASGYQSGQTIIINIPTSPNLVMAPSESVLKFNLTVKNGADASNYMRLDKCGGHGIVSRLRLYHGSQLLEDLDNYGNIVSQLNVLQKSSACNGKDSILQGFSNDQLCDSTTKQVTPILAGERLNVDGAADEFAVIAIDAPTIERTYCINLLSVLGSLSDKYLPLFAMTSSPLRLELQLVSNPNKFICAHEAMAEFTVNNCEFVAQMIELGDSAMSSINASLQGSPLQWVVPQYRNYATNIVVGDAVATQVSIPVPAKFNSLKSLFMTLREKSVGAATFFPHASCTHSLSDYTVRIGSKVIPSKAPQNPTEFFVELLKSIGSVSDINHECMIDYDNYKMVEPLANVETVTRIDKTSSCASFMIGVDLETYSNADKSSIFAGWNSSNEDIFFQLAFAGQAGGAGVRADTYALYDAVLVCEAGICSVRYKINYF